MKVLTIGNAPSVKGGITSVIAQILGHDWKSDGVEMSFIPTYIDNDITKFLYYMKAYGKIEKMFRTAPPDVVHIHMSYRGSFVRKYRIHRLCMKYNIPDIVHLHGSEFKKWYDESDERTRKKIKRLLRETGKFIVLGNEWNEAVKEMEPMTNTLVVSNTVSMPSESVKYEDPFKVLFLGVLIKRKGVSDLLKAIRMIKDKKTSISVKYYIAGSGAEERALKEECTKLGLDQDVSFLGWTVGEQKTNLLKICQMLVLPSYNEGLPIAVLEAISYGMPVVASNVGDISSAVIDEENGYLITAGDVGSLADKMEIIISNKDIWKKMSQQSRNIAKDKFSEEMFFEKLKKCYFEVGGHS